MNNSIENNKWHKSNRWYCEKCKQDYHPTYKYTHLKSKVHESGYNPSNVPKEIRYKEYVKKYYDKNQDKLVKYQKEFYYGNHEKNKEIGRKYKQKYKVRDLEKEYKTIIESIKNETETIQKNSLEIRLKQIKNKLIDCYNKWQISTELSTSLKTEE